MLRVLGRTNSINVRKVLWLCEELGLPHVSEPWGTGDLDLKSPEFLALSPHGLVPVVVDGDAVLRESNTICRYLAGVHRRDDLLPTEPLRRARVEQWMDWQATELNNAWRTPFLGLVRHQPAHQDPEALRAGTQAWNRQMTLLDAHLQGTGGWAAGETFTLADIVLGLAINRWVMTPIERPALAAVSAYVDRLAARPGHALHCRNGMP